MKAINKVILLILIFSMFSMVFLSVLQNEKIKYTNDPESTLSVKADPPIHIDGNNELNTTASSGTGTAGDPYIIENKVINASGTGSHGIWIENTNAYFTLRNCMVSYASGKAGIMLENVTNANLKNNILFNNSQGIYLLTTDNINITDNTAYNNFNGIRIQSSNHTTVINNTANSNTGGGIYQCYHGTHNTYTNNTANYNAQYGIILYYSYSGHETTLFNNTASYNTIYGFFCWSSEYTRLFNNTANQNDNLGIYLNNVIDSTISFNTVNDNNNAGIYLKDSARNNVTWNILYRNRQCINESHIGANLIENNDCFNRIAPTLTSGSVSPATGTTSTSFTFTVNYTDANDEAPSFIRVVINGSSHDMEKQNPSDTTFTDGCIYNYSTTLTAGNYTYYFEASDGTETARSPSTGAHSGPSVSAVEEDGEAPISGFTWPFAVLGLLVVISLMIAVLRKQDQTRLT